MKCLLIVALATLQVVAGQEVSCGDSWSLYEAENKCIRAFGKVKDSWPGAETACEREGGRIVTIHNKEAHAFVDKLVKDDGSVFWIGLTRTPKDTNWVWQDGTTLGEYHAWAKGEPNNALTYEDCVQRYSTGSWNDNDCNVRNSYICEKEGPGCKRNNGGCSADAICVDPADGGWHVTCRCHHGYALEDGHCYDINECSFNNGGCDDICTNNDGSFACSCREGYVAVGKTCTQDTIVG